MEKGRERREKERERRRGMKNRERDGVKEGNIKTG
jgi:hypothetical protein